MGPLRPVDGPDARHAVLEAMRPEAGHVVIHYLHLAAAESWVLKQVQLVIRAILGARSRGEPAAPPTLRTGLLRRGKESSHNRITPTPERPLPEGGRRFRRCLQEGREAREVPPEPASLGILEPGSHEAESGP